MTIGMAVNSGMEAKKAQMAELLEHVAVMALDLGLWIEGKPFDITVRQIAAQIGPATSEESQEYKRLKTAGMGVYYGR